MKVNDIMQSIRETTPPEVRKQVDLSVSISNRIFELLEQNKMSQKDLARALNKTETEVSRWLSGTHNLTLATIAKIACVLDDDIIVTTRQVQIRPYDFEKKDMTSAEVADDSSPVII